MKFEGDADPNSGTKDGGQPTLHDLLYSQGTKLALTENDWLRLLRWIEAKDPVALHTLYQLTHRIVFTLIFRITNDWEVAEEETVEVFQDVRRNPLGYDTSRGSVVGWITEMARSKALRHRSMADPEALYHFLNESILLREALSELTIDELQAIETAFFSESNCEEVAEKLQVSSETVKSRIRGGMDKLRRVLGSPAGLDFVHSQLHLDSVYLYVLQALPAKEALHVEWQIFECGHCIREVSSLRPVIQKFVCWQTDLLRPASSLWLRLARKIGEETGDPPMLAPPDLGHKPFWQEVAAGISCKLLAADAGKNRVSLMVRLAPGADYPPHRHADLEELYLLHGELMVNENKIYPGYYHRAEAGSEDHRVWTQTGCTCVLFTSTQDVIL